MNCSDSGTLFIVIICNRKSRSEKATIPQQNKYLTTLFEKL